MKTLCGTGHRPQDLPNKFEYNWKKDISNIQKFILENNITKVITGMALGFDQALAIAVIELKDAGYKIHLEAAIPCNGQDSVWAEGYRELYKRILERCDSKVIISDKYTQTCMQARNEYMVDNADVVLAFYNGKGYGGTFNCIEYAKKVGKPVVNIFEKYDVKKELKGEKIMKFTKMYNVKDNRELKKVNGNVILDIRTRETEDLLDINRQVHRLKNGNYRVVLQSPKGRLLPSRALGKYTREHVNIELGGLNHKQVIAKLVNMKSMMSHKEYVDVPVYEQSYPSAFDHKVPKTDEDGNVVTQTVEKTVYLDRVYTITVNGEYCHNKKYKKLAKSFKIPLATVIGNQIVNPDDESYLLEDCTEDVIELIKKKYETISPEKKEMLLKFFGLHDSNISDFEDFAYAMIHFKMFRVDGLPLPNKVDAEEFINMLGMFKVPNAYDLVYDMAEKGMLVHLEDYPELRHFEEARFYEDSYMEDEEDILD